MAAQQRVVLADPSADPWIRRLLALLALLLIATALAALWGAAALAPDSPLAAALIASFALGTGAAFALSARRRLWPEVRIGALGATVLSWIVLALAAGRFDPAGWQREEGLLQFGDALLAAAVLLLPALLFGLGLAQWRRPAVTRPGAARMAAVSRATFGLVALLLGAPSLALLLGVEALPLAAALPDLDATQAQVVAALALSQAAMAAHAGIEGDWQRARPAVAGFAIAGLAALAAAVPALQAAPLAAAVSQPAQGPAASGLPDPSDLALAAVVALALLGLGLALQAARRIAALPRPRCLRWRLAGEVDEVAALLADPQGYPRWWGSVCRELQVMLRGDARGIGRLVRLRARGVGPGELQLRMRLVEERLPHAFSVAVDGDLQGQLDWRLSAHGPWVDVSCQWTARPTRRLWRAGWFALEPLLRVQQRWAMRRGEEGLRRELVRRHARDEAARSRLANAPGPVHGLRGVLRALPELLAATGAPLRLTQRALVEAPLGEVFDFAARIDNDALWRADVLRVEQRVDGPLVGVGRELRITQRLAGRAMRREMRVVAWQAGRHVAVESSDGAYRCSREFEALDDVTSITETEDIVLPWWLRPFSGMVAAAAARSAAAAYGRLAELLEEPGTTEPADSLLRARPA